LAQAESIVITGITARNIFLLFSFIDELSFNFLQTARLLSPDFY
jgi:uncharacterized protein YdeI (YjbR/CyaY-like superfamily)